MEGPKKEKQNKWPFIFCYLDEYICICIKCIDRKKWKGDEKL